jgi:hypothetical protein
LAKSAIVTDKATSPFVFFLPPFDCGDKLACHDECNPRGVISEKGNIPLRFVIQIWQLQNKE